MILCLTAVILVSVFIRRPVVSQKTISYNDEYDGREIIRVRHLHEEIEVVRQMATVQERQLSEMRILLEAVHRSMEQLITNYSMNDCFKSQPAHRHSYQSLGAGQNYYDPDASDKSVSLIARLDITDRWVYGVTKLNNQIYVLCYGPNSIMVSGDKAPFSLREIETQQFRSPYNIVASQPWNCLFVIDIGNHCIWKISTDENDTISLWLSDLPHVTSLSVTTDGRVLIINEDDTFHNLEIYGQDAALTDRIQLHNLGIPFNAVQTSSDSFIVSHKVEAEEEEDGDIWLISEIDSKGILLRSSRDKGEARLSEPSHLFIDSNDRLFVADRWDSRVILFDTELSWNQTILSEGENGIQLPLRVYYDDLQHQLIVISGAGGGEKVDVYNFEFR